MEGISDIKIIGIDDKRPPIIRKEPYIDIYFKLSHQAPKEWCRDLNNLLSQNNSASKISETEGLYIETWVRTPDDIAVFLVQLQDAVTECTRQYIERIEISTRNNSDANATLADEAGEQGRLNRILAELDFGE